MCFKKLHSFSKSCQKQTFQNHYLYQGFTPLRGNVFAALGLQIVFCLQLFRRWRLATLSKRIQIFCAIEFCLDVGKTLVGFHAFMYQVGRALRSDERQIHISSQIHHANTAGAGNSQGAHGLKKENLELNA